jgi:hypothetical protein
MKRISLITLFVFLFFSFVSVCSLMAKNHDDDHKSWSEKFKDRACSASKWADKQVDTQNTGDLNDLKVVTGGAVAMFCSDDDC